MSNQVSTEPQVEQKTNFFPPFNYNNPYLKYFGALGYLGIQCIIYPLERIKVLQQTKIIPEVFDENGKYLRYQNLRAYYDKLVETETTEAFYRGLGAKLTKLITKELSIYFISDRITQKFQKFNPQEDPLKHAASNLISAAVSGMLIETYIYPIEVAKTRILCDCADYESRSYTNMYEALYKDQLSPFRSMYHGALFSLGGVALYRGLQIGLYETLLQFGLKDKSQLIQLPTSILITVLAQRLTYPLDTIRRYIMLKNTPFEVTSDDIKTIVKSSSHPDFKKDFMKGWNKQFYKSISTGMFLFAYKALKGTLNTSPDLITQFSSI